MISLLWSVSCTLNTAVRRFSNISFLALLCLATFSHVLLASIDILFNCCSSIMDSRSSGIGICFFLANTRRTSVHVFCSYTITFNFTYYIPISLSSLLQLSTSFCSLPVRDNDKLCKFRNKWMNTSSCRYNNDSNYVNIILARNFKIINNLMCLRVFKQFQQLKP